MSKDNLSKIANDFKKLAKELGEKPNDFTESKTGKLPELAVRVKSKPSVAAIARDLQKVNDLTIQYIREELKIALDAAMSANIWEGGNDIIDTGELMNSLEVTISDNKVTMTYTAEYAALVHYGGYIIPYGNRAADRVYIPGRPWIEAVIQGYGAGGQIDFSALYNRAFQQIMG